jgi:preprotein translocase subunit SecD
MQKNLKWKLLIILAIMVICVLCFVWPREKGAGFMSRINLGLDLKGGMHLVLQVETDEALNQELYQTAGRITQELKKKNIAFDYSKKGNGYTVEVAGVPSSQENEARSYLDSAYKSNYAVRSNTLEGKTRFTIALTPRSVREMKEQTVQQALETIRRRVDSLGVTEPSLQIYGGSGHDVDDQIMIELPGVDDPDRVKSLIENTAQLEFRLVAPGRAGGPFSSLESALQANGGKLPEDYQVLPEDKAGENGQMQYLVVSRSPVITGKDLKTARKTTDDRGLPAVGFFLTSDGANIFSDFTEKHRGDRLAVVLNNSINSAPEIQDKIGADGIIRGSFTVQAANDLALVLRSGALPASLTILSQQSVGASLGYDSIRSGIYASIIGFGLVVLGMVIYYKHSGLNAVWCLLGNLIILLGFMGAAGSTLTLPGIAGIILTIGMAVDSNILIFERIREELHSGKTIRAAIDTGFSKVLWTIIDTHVTTLVSALFLFGFGTGPIKGFAVTLTVGLIANMFTAVWVSHRLFDMMLGNRKVESLSI